MTEPASTAAEPETPSLANSAIARCAVAWDRTYDLASIDPDDDSLEPEHHNHDFFACRQAAIAFRKAMPPLSGHQNIQDFIACVTYALLSGIMNPDEAKELFGAAQVALSAIRAEPRQPKF